MVNLESYDCNVVEETAASKAVRYRLLNQKQLADMYKNALAAQAAGKPWKDTTLEALVEVATETGVITFNG